MAGVAQEPSSAEGRCAAWRKSGARESDIPSQPGTIYKHDGWQGCGHWLGTGTVAHQNQPFLPFKHALLYARSLKLKSKAEWQAWSKSGVRPANVPAIPENPFKHDGWQGYVHWLGTGAISTKDHQFLPYEKALLQARSLKLKDVVGWKAWSKSDAWSANMPG